MPPARTAAPTPTRAAVANAIRALPSWTSRPPLNAETENATWGCPVLRGKDPAADRVGRASLEERHGGDISESPAGARERHSREADRKDGGDACQRQACRARRERDDEDAYGLCAEDSAGERRAHRRRRAVRSSRRIQLCRRAA